MINPAIETLFPAVVTPSANRNSYRVASRVGFLPRVEVLRPSTLGYVIATPSELLLLVGHNSSLMMRPQGLYMISLLSLVCAPTTMYAYTIVDDAPPRVIHNWFVVDDVRPYNHVWLSHRGRYAPLATL